VLGLGGLSSTEQEWIKKSDLGPQLEQLTQKFKDKLKEFEASNNRQALEFLINSLSNRKQLSDGLK
jgi:geranylgeranyl pyrophosphate synthase